ncbi:molybdenum-dependent transcriptional regulator [Phenylobacterium hankyongense]|uniref:Molybdenum-dependent transcriptional regulator n=1 Tax=Phenylobacterium hankyongense TaxID=1813876 RepID=A0A328B2G5_9CAUL|nr:TOBE domain-containing protein [Phenylobacterium hankyongense]RAK60631.1 molybdenum-dependent transcriptional regulator [Phenylobacterium hankyongense]
MSPDPLSAAFSLRRGAGARVGPERMALLQAVGDFGSIRAAALRVGLSYKAAWDAIQALNNLFDAPLVAARPGGRQGGAAELTPRGRAVLAAFQRVETELAEVAQRLERGLAGAPADDLGAIFWSLGMRTSARNALRGVVSRVVEGEVNAEVALRVAEGVEIVAVVTRRSVAALGLEPGRAAVALIKSSFVLLAKGEGLVTSARNQLAGRVLARDDGGVSSEVTLEIADGKTLTATITRESADRLGLAPDEAVTALIKAPHVILAVE